MAPAITRVTLLRNTVNDIVTADAFDITSDFLSSVTPTDDGTTVTYTGANVERTGLMPGTTYYFYLEVEDQSGNTTSQSLGSITTASAYSPDITAAVDFDLTSPGMHMDLTVASTTETEGTMSFWFKRNSEVSMGFFATESTGAFASMTGASVLVGSSSGVRYVFLRIDGTTILTTTEANMDWNHVLWSWNSTSGQFYLNDVAVSMTGSIPKGSYLKNNIVVGPMYNNGTFDHSLDACMAEVYYGNEYIDLSVEANRRKFISASGSPVSLGADGSLPTGNQPDVYLSGVASNWNAGKNFGSAGNFTVTSTITDCAISPGIASPLAATVTSDLSPTGGALSNVLINDLSRAEFGSGSTVTVTVDYTNQPPYIVSSYLLHVTNHDTVVVKFYDSGDNLIYNQGHTASSYNDMVSVSLTDVKYAEVKATRSSNTVFLYKFIASGF
jgi:hypothetical protein